MGHHGNHHHDHGAATSRKQSSSRLAWTLVLTLCYMLAEIIGGLVSGSLALLADAAHMFSDAAALGLSLFAIWIAGRPATPQHSYGYHRAEILAALANGTALVVISVYVFGEAIHRLRAPHEVAGELMMDVSIGGLAVNLAGLALLHTRRAESLNLRGAWLHLLTDALGSIAALAAGSVIWAFGWHWADAVASIAIGVLVIYSAWDLVKQAVAILMESTPSHLDIDAVRTSLVSAPGVCDVHDLHVWTITGGMESLSAHAVLAEGHSPTAALKTIRQVLHEQFGITHVTIQIESADHDDCGTSFE